MWEDGVREVSQGTREASKIQAVVTSRWGGSYGSLFCDKFMEVYIYALSIFPSSLNYKQFRNFNDL
jgi:hypothetical protein